MGNFSCFPKIFLLIFQLEKRFFFFAELESLITQKNVYLILMNKISVIKDILHVELDQKKKNWMNICKQFFSNVSKL